MKAENIKNWSFDDEVFDEAKVRVAIEESSLSGEMKLEFFLENFDKISLEVLENFVEK